MIIIKIITVTYRNFFCSWLPKLLVVDKFFLHKQVIPDALKLQQTQFTLASWNDYIRYYNRISVSVYGKAK